MAIVQWNRGPWATPRPVTPQPYQSVSTPAPATRSPYQALLGDVSGGGLGGNPGATGPRESGPYGTPTSNLGAIGGRLGQIGLGMALTGALPSPASFAMLGLPIASYISRALGTPNTVDPFAGIRSMDEQSIRDTFGAFAADAIARDRANAEFGLRGAGPSSYSETVAGTPSVANPDIDTTQPGWGSNILGFASDSRGETQGGRDPGGYGGSSTPGGPSSDGRGHGGAGTGGGDGGQSGEGSAAGDSGGHGSAGDSSMNARGGVIRTRPNRPKTAIFGEGEAAEEGETGIFVPEYMKRKGFQGRERQVRRGLKSAYSSLTGDRGKR